MRWSEDALLRANASRDSPFLRSKVHILDALELQAPALAGTSTEEFWRGGSSVLDVGAGNGEIALYLQQKYRVRPRALDVHSPDSGPSRKYWRQVAALGKRNLTAALPIETFDGSSLPLGNCSTDLVMFNSVLHHAAHKAETLVLEAARVARRWIVILEDLSVPGHRNIEHRNLIHDPSGVFRTLDEWRRILHAPPQVSDVQHDMLCQHLDDTRLPCFSFNTSHRLFYIVFLVRLRTSTKWSC